MHLLKMKGLQEGNRLSGRIQVSFLDCDSGSKTLFITHHSYWQAIFHLSAKPGTSLWSCTAGIVLVVLGGVTGEESEDVQDTTHTFYHAKSILPPKLTLTLTKTINL